MAGGWSRDGAVQDQIDASVADAVDKARGSLPQGDSLSHCEECDDEIPQARRQAVPGVRYCVRCQQQIDDESIQQEQFNRRANKDSLLR